MKTIELKIIECEECGKEIRTEKKKGDKVQCKKCGGRTEIK